MLAPDGQVRLGHPGICGQNKHDSMCLRNQTHRQLRLGTNGIQTRRIQNHQALLEQRVRDVDQCMAPLGHLNQAVSANQRVVVNVFVVPKPQCSGIVFGHMAHLRNFFQCLGKLLWVVDIEVNPGPFFRHGTPLHQRLGLEPRFNRQQAQTRRYIRVIAQFCRTHGGTARTGRHDAPAVTGKKDGVDQL